MEREQIIKVLESIVGEEEVFCEVCPYKAAYCNRLVLCDTLALIKELTEENERLESISINKDITIEAINEVIKQLNEDNERLKNICNSYALQYGTARDKEVFLRKEREYTVRKFAERLKAICWGEIISPSTIDRIAKEILEGEME